MVKKWILKLLKKDIDLIVINALEAAQKECMNKISYPLDFKGKDGAGKIIQRHINSIKNP